MECEVGLAAGRCPAGPCVRVPCGADPAGAGRLEAGRRGDGRGGVQEEGHADRQLAVVGGASDARAGWRGAPRACGRRGRGGGVGSRTGSPHRG
eukprot:5648520-Heterocapsa_arctica.AAC.1